ncbi:MAG TPA: universal stress protein [Actinomycetota bacterium]
MRTRRVVLGVDGSEGGEHAMRWVVDLASDLSLEVTAVHAFDLLTVLGVSEGAFASVDDKTLLKAAREEMEGRWVAPLREAGVNFQAEVVEGNPAGAILDTARTINADMIVVGAHGRSGFKEMLLGSVSSHVSHHADVPVVIIRPAKK